MSNPNVPGSEGKLIDLRILYNDETAWTKDEYERFKHKEEEVKPNRPLQRRDASASRAWQY